MEIDVSAVVLQGIFLFKNFSGYLLFNPEYTLQIIHYRKKFHNAVFGPVWIPE